jgi:hypothetical protein
VKGFSPLQTSFHPRTSLQPSTSSSTRSSRSISCVDIGFGEQPPVNGERSHRIYSRINIILLSGRSNNDSSLPATASSESSELLSLLIQKYTTKATKEEIERIETLMQSLQNQNISFDPEKCLNGPLFAVLHQTGPVPFWEKYDLGLSFARRKNIKGQRYLSNANGDYDLLNYAEFIGDTLIAQASGVCEKNPDSTSSSDENRNGASFFTNLFKNPNANEASERTKCPADYTIQATSARVLLFNNKLDIDIQGTGYMRVLYADENLRILTAPKDTTSTEGRVDEKAGLTVVQVRVDLVDPSFSL